MPEPERRVTAIEPQRRNSERVNVFLDGAFAFGLPAAVLTDFKLHAGRMLTIPEIAELQELDETSKATEAAIRLLTARPRSVRELQMRLRKKEYGDETIERVIERLRERKYIDDDAFAKFWVENREANRPRGRRLLEQELRSKGVERESVSNAIDDAEIDELSGALAIARAKMRSYSGLEATVANRRLSAFLARRGYGYSVIKPVIEQLFDESDDDDGLKPDNLS